MRGARDYAVLFETGQYGRLYITSSHHARGRTFHIQVLPEGEAAQDNGCGNLCLNKNAVEVYGVIAGNPGWTEEYGWLYHKGRWREDFERMVQDRKKEIACAAEGRKKERNAEQEAESARRQGLLATYK